MVSQQDVDPMTQGTAFGASAEPLPPQRGGGTRNLVIGIGIGVAIAVIGTQILGGSSSEPITNAPPVESEASRQAVTVATVQSGTVADVLTVTGTVQPADLLTVTPQIGGLQIREVLVEVGDRVAAGQPLVILDDADLRTQIQQAQAQIDVATAQVAQQRASLAQAQATFNEASTNLNRYQTLQAQGAVSAEELDSRATQAATAREAVGVAQATLASAEATVRSRQADLERLRTQLTYTVVRAPSPGVVAERPASVGDVSSTGNGVVTLIRDGQLELAAEVPQIQLEQVTLGAPVRVFSSTDRSIQGEGTVQKIEPLVDAATRTARVIIGLPGSDRLRSGMFLTADIQISTRTGLTLPASAVLPQPDGTVQVLVLGEDDTAIARLVEIGSRTTSAGATESQVEIVSGVQPGERVIVAGASYVQPGDRVTVADRL